MFAEIRPPAATIIGGGKDRLTQATAYLLEHGVGVSWVEAKAIARSMQKMGEVWDDKRHKYVQRLVSAFQGRGELSPEQIALLDDEIARRNPKKEPRPRRPKPEPPSRGLTLGETAALIRQRGREGSPWE